MVSRALRPAHDAVTAFRSLEARLRRITADGDVTRAEKRALDAHAERVEGRVQGLVAHTAAPALDALADFGRMDRGALARRADDALEKLADGRHRLWREARHDARTDPFRGMRGERAPFPGVRTKDFRWEGL